MAVHTNERTGLGKAAGRWLDRFGRSVPAFGLMAVTMADPCSPGSPAGDGGSTNAPADSGTHTGGSGSTRQCGADERPAMLCQQPGATCEYTESATCPNNYHLCWCTDSLFWTCTDSCAP